MPQDIPFQDVVDALLDQSKPFPARLLHRFSDLHPHDLQTLLTAWPGIPVQRRHDLLEDLEDLAETDSLTNFEDLAAALLTDTDPIIKAAAVRLLFENTDKNLVPIFLDLLKNDPDGSVRATAANILGQFVLQGELEEIPGELLHEIEEHLLHTARNEKEALIRRRALESLGYSSRDEVIPLIEAAFADRDPDWVSSALFAMGRSADERWKKQVLSRLRDIEQVIRTEAVRASGELELMSARPVLLELLEDEEDAETRREIIWALSKLGGEGVRDRLEELQDMVADDDEAEFIEEALDNLFMSENMSGLDMLAIEPDEDLMGDDQG